MLRKIHIPSKCSLQKVILKTAYLTFFFQLKLLVTRKLHKLSDLETEETALPDVLLGFANSLKTCVSGILVCCFGVQEI
jgi:hypothetical protein